MSKFTFILILLTFPCIVSGAWLRNVPLTLQQPDGRNVKVFITGDEYYQRLHDSLNNTILPDPLTGFFVYAIFQQGELVPGTLRVGDPEINPKALEHGLEISNEKKEAIYKKALGSSFFSPGPADAGITINPDTGIRHNLVIFIRFNDQDAFSDSYAFYDGLLNNPDNNAVSLYNYYREVSYNKLEIFSSFYPNFGTPTIISYKDSHNQSYFSPISGSNPDGYTSAVDRTVREQDLLKDALETIEDQIPPGSIIDGNNDGLIDNIVMLIRGGIPAGAGEILWPHKSHLINGEYYINGKRVYDYNLQLEDLISGGQIGVLCHEMFHTLGAPDLYHKIKNGINPLGNWDLMEWNGDIPHHMSAYMKYRYGGWILEIPVIEDTGTYTLQPITSPVNNAYRINSQNSVKEFFIVENRQQSGVFESGISGSGLLIYRINETVSGNYNGPPDMVYVYRPNGTLEINGNPADANFDISEGRDCFSAYTNPNCFLSNGADADIKISDIGTSGPTISFKLMNPEQPELWIKGFSGLLSGMVKNTFISSGKTGVIWMTGEKIPAGNPVYSRSTDGGISWLHEEVSAYPGSEATCVYGINSDIALVTLRQNTGGGLILKTRDAGNTWEEVGPATYWGPDGYPRIIHFWDTASGICIGDPNQGYFEIWRTSDTGNTWMRLPSLFIPANLDGEEAINGHFSAIGDHLWFGTNKGRIIHSSDKGINWSSIAIPGLSGKTDVRFLTTLKGMAINRDLDPAVYGDLYETLDGGISWSTVPASGSYYKDSFCWVPGTRNTCISAGSGTESGCAWSPDGGHTWHPFPETTSEQFTTCVFTDQYHGWGGGYTNFWPTTIGGIFRFKGGLPGQSVNLKPLKIVSPTSNVNVPGSQSVVFTFTNTGNTPVADIPVKFYDFSGNSGSEIISSMVLPGDTVIYTFSTPAVFQNSGLYDFAIYIDDERDQNHDDDTISHVIFKLKTIEQEVGSTLYDLQTNGSNHKRIHAFADSTLSVCWNYGLISPGFADRGTGYNYFNNTQWGLMPQQRIENVRTGWPETEDYGSSGELIVSHTGTNSGLILSKRNTKGNGLWNFSTKTGPAGNLNLLAPCIVTNGAGNTTIHIVSLTAPLANGGALYKGQDGALVYSRSLNGGTTWDINNMNLPGTDTSLYAGLHGDKFVFINHGDTLALVYGNQWTDLFLLKSTDNGSTWNKTILFHHPYPKFKESQTLVTDTITVCDGSISAAFDPEGKVHISFGLMQVWNHITNNGVTSQLPGSDGLVYWNESMEALTSLDIDSLAWKGNLIARAKDENGDGSITVNPGIYNTSISGMPSMDIDDLGNILVVFSSIRESLLTGTQNYRHLNAVCFDNFHKRWTDIIDLHENSMYNNSECVFPSLTRFKNKYSALFQADYLPGMAVTGDLDPYLYNSIRVITIESPFHPKMDAGVTDILAPVSAFNLGIQDTVRIRITNAGNVAITNLLAHLIIDGDTLLTDTIADPPAPGMSMEYRFSEGSDFSIQGHTYHVKIHLISEGDKLNKNDTLCKDIRHKPQATGSIGCISACPNDTIRVPVVISEIYGATGILLFIDYAAFDEHSGQLKYLGYENLHPGLSGGTCNHYASPTNQILFTWRYEPVRSLLFLQNDTIFNLVFITDTLPALISWVDTVPLLSSQWTDEFEYSYLIGTSDCMVTIQRCSSISGEIHYDNNQNSPITNASAYLFKNGTFQVSNVVTSTGDFTFQELSHGNYELSAGISTPPGGFNAVDAMLVLQHFTGNINLSPIRTRAADVNNAGGINSVDALLIARRFVNLIPTFPAGNWFVMNDTIQLQINQSASSSLNSICFGDLNGSYIPGLSPKCEGSFVTKGLIEINGKSDFNIPVSITAPIMAGSMSIVLPYNPKNVEIKDITGINSAFASGQFIYNITLNEIRIAAYSISGFNLLNDQPLFSIKGQLHSVFSNGTESIFRNTVETHFTGIDGAENTDIKLMIPEISFYECNSGPVEHISNEGDGIIQLRISGNNSAPIDLRIFDQLGRVIYNDQIESFTTESSIYQIRKELQPGLYVLNASLQGNNSGCTQILKIITIKSR